MKRARIALSAGALLCGFASTVAFAQDDDIFDSDFEREVFDRVFDEDRDGGLPNGATLLSSGDTECQGALVASGIGRDGEDVRGIQQGEERVFRVADRSVPWACLGPRSARADIMECAEGTTDVRISHEGNVARFECYGSRR